MLNKKAQVSEIMTWVVATVIILSILLVFVYVSSLLAQKTKILKISDLKIDFDKKVNLIATKNLITYNSASKEQKILIDKWEEKKNEMG